MPKSFLDIAVDHLMNNMSNKILGKHKQMLKSNDYVTVNGRVDIFCSTFNMLCQSKWLDN